MKTCCLIPAHNAGDTIATALDSCQEFDRVIVWDDGSTDNTDKVAGSFDKVTVIGGHHVGMQQARHELYLAAGDFDVIAYLDADDYRLPGMLQKHVEQLIKQGVDALLTSTLILPKGYIPIPKNVIDGILGVRFQTGGLLVRRSAMDTLFKNLNYTWRVDAKCYLEGLFAWDLYRTGLTFGYDDRPGSVYNIGWSAQQFTAKLKMSDRLQYLDQLVAEIRDFLGDAWAIHEHSASQYRRNLEYRLRRGG